MSPNESMKWVCCKLADQQSSWRLEKDEFQKNFNQAKSFINNLKQQLREKDETIHVLQEKVKRSYITLLILSCHTFYLFVVAQPL